MKITICGSIAFYPEMETLRQQLEGRSHEVKLPELRLEAPKEFGGGKKVNFGKYVEENGGLDAFPPDHAIWALKKAAIEDHYEKIDWAEAILVVNHTKRDIEGYIGGSTLMEVGVAFYLHKPIFILNPISSELSYKHEILSMDPVVLHGNLDLMKL